MFNFLYTITALIAICTLTSGRISRNGYTVYGDFKEEVYYTCYTGLSGGSPGHYPEWNSTTKGAYKKATKWFVSSAITQSWFDHPYSFSLSGDQKLLAKFLKPPATQPFRKRDLILRLSQSEFYKIFEEIVGELSSTSTPVDYSCCLFQREIPEHGTWRGTLATTVAASFLETMFCPGKITDESPPYEPTPEKVLPNETPKGDQCDPSEEPPSKDSSKSPSKAIPS